MPELDHKNVLLNMNFNKIVPFKMNLKNWYFTPS